MTLYDLTILVSVMTIQLDIVGRQVCASRRIRPMQRLFAYRAMSLFDRIRAIQGSRSQRSKSRAAWPYDLRSNELCRDHVMKCVRMCMH